MIKNNLLILLVVSTFTAILISNPITAFGVPNKSNDRATVCESTGKKSSNGLELVQCCWFVEVSEGTGFEGGNEEWYCSECENGGTRGNINCSEPELQYRTVPSVDGSVFPNNDIVTKDPQTEQPPVLSNRGTNLGERLASEETLQNYSPNEENQINEESTEANEFDTTTSNAQGGDNSANSISEDFNVTDG